MKLLMLRSVTIGLLTLLVVTGWVPGSDARLAAASEVMTDVAIRSYPIVRDDVTLSIDYCGNGALDADASIRRVVVMIHGQGRNACDYAAVGVEAARLAGTLHETLVIAPHFISTEASAAAEEPDRLYWSTGGWKVGSNSHSTPFERPWRLSSFAVVDELLLSATKEFTNLQDTVVAGHSAGGQFVNRYAISTTVAGNARFVVANPSSYLYLDDRRFSGGRFAVPQLEDIEACPEYDTYKYGMTGLYAYLRAVGPETLRAQYGERDVTYLLGEEDTDEDDPSLDTRCPARLQGNHRLERGERYYAALEHVYDSSVYNTHMLTTIPGAGHGVRATFTSAEGIEALFGTASEVDELEQDEPVVDKPAKPGKGLGRATS